MGERDEGARRVGCARRQQQAGGKGGAPFHFERVTYKILASCRVVLGGSTIFFEVLSIDSVVLACPEQKSVLEKSSIDQTAL